ncbi:hypothetical protein BD410DRAFT_361544 [Rickenella mellea]|uniref:Uncharacterized protein n=1 Tax=Rickenella mellea TaxID=50990 RepID=A0A4Y7PZQ0_9AGAM|nr:hypothetical protein BD410DRAFT_361544 [Rickenella mellea]
MATTYPDPVRTDADTAVNVSDGNQSDNIADIYAQFATYPFETDEVFLEGLRGIAGSGAVDGLGDDERAYVIGRAKAFYFTKTQGKEVTWEEYVRWSGGQGSAGGPSSLPAGVAAPPPPPSSTTPAPPSDPKELSLAEISALIESGQTHLIPNNEVIPGGLSEEPPSETYAPPRKKPWEDATTTATTE